MTETELRQKVVNTAKSFYGAKQGGKLHRCILEGYNSFRPLARGYAVQENDPWCATFVSYISILCGITDILPTECGCGPQIALFQKLGEWVENDGYRPRAGDVIFYDWDDSGTGDNQGGADHVGIVVSLSGSTIRVIEGNKSGAVGYRDIQVNGRYIRGYGVPDYAKKAGTSGAEQEDDNVKRYKNGSTPEPVYADTGRSLKVGSLNPWEECDCLGEVGGMFIVRYPVDGTSFHKVGLVVYNGVAA